MISSSKAAERAADIVKSHIGNYLKIKMVLQLYQHQSITGSKLLSEKHQADFSLDLIHHSLSFVLPWELDSSRTSLSESSISIIIL